MFAFDFNQLKLPSNTNSQKLAQQFMYGANKSLSVFENTAQRFSLNSTNGIKDQSTKNNSEQEMTKKNEKTEAYLNEGELKI